MTTTPTILLIEDNPPLRENITVLLSLSGYDVLAFDSGPPALEKLKETTPDLLLCDIILPGINGYDILAEVRKMPSATRIPFIFLSALAERDQVREGMNLGADDYVTKPFTSEGLLAAVQARLDLDSKRRAAEKRERESFHARSLEELPHEIRTPLNGIVVGMQLLRLEEEKLGKEGAEVLNTMEQSAERLEKTVLNYILFLSLAAGRDPFVASKTTVDAGLVVTAVATKQAEDCGRESDLILHTVESHTGCEGCLDRIASELVSNAFKFSQPGSKVEVRLRQDEGRLTLSCRDQGCGMTGEEIAEIGPFKQFHRKEREQQGLGLGLAICKARLLHCPDCHLDFQPAEPSGLTVTLSLPLPPAT